MRGQGYQERLGVRIYRTRRSADYAARVAFNNLTDAELAVERAAIASAALTAARLAAARRLIDGPISGFGGEIDPEAATAILHTRDSSDQRYEWLAAFEKPWSLLVLKLIAGTIADPTIAIRDARDRGATVADIANALGITTQGVYATYSDAVVRRHK
jgi:hypothetical protein